MLSKVNAILSSDGRPSEFHRVRILKSALPYKVDFNIFAFGEKGAAFDTHEDEKGLFTVDVRQPISDTRHLALGKFMDEWSKLELTLKGTLCNMIGLPFEAIHSVSNSLGTSGMINALSSLSEYRMLNSEGQKIFEKLLERTRANNTRRNRIAHGLWVLEIYPVDRNGTPHIKLNQVREYHTNHPDHDQLAGDPKNKTFRKNNIFSIRRIHSIRTEISGLNVDIADFNKSLTRVKRP